MMHVARQLPLHLVLRMAILSAVLAISGVGYDVECGSGLRAAEPAQGVLHWQNGDQLPGELVGADANTLRWQATLFSTPFNIDITTLSAIQYPAPAEVVKANLPFRLVTVANDVLLGDLVDITNQQLVVSSPRHGKLQLNRSQFIGLQRHDRQATSSVGLGLLSDWTSLHRGRELSEWTRGVDGQIETKVTGAELYRDLHLTSLSEIEISLSWTGKPGFMISFAGSDAVRLSKQVVKLETWESDLVLQTLGANGDFEVIQTIPDEMQSLELRLQWNPVEGELSVYSSLGQLLGKMKGEPLPGTQPSTQLSGIYIQNKAATLKLARLRANGWEGAGEDLPAGSVRVRLADAKTLVGKTAGIDAATKILKLDLASGVTQNIPLSEIDSIDLGNQAAQQSAAVPARITFLDGTQIGGALEGVRDGAVEMKTSFSDDLVRAELDGIFGIRFAPAKDVIEVVNQDVIKFEQGKLRGDLIAVEDQDNAIGWRPVGSANASKLPIGQPLRITLATTAPADAQRKNSYLDRIFLRNGDAVPCNIHSIDVTHLDVDVPLTENSRIERSKVVAIEFGTFAGAISESFADQQWVVPHVKEVTRSDTELKVSGTTSIGYDNIRDADEIAFDVKWNMLVPSLIRVSLFTDGPGEIGQVPSVMLYRTTGTRIMLQAVQVAGAGEMMGNVRGVAPVQTRDGCNSFRFRILQDKVVVYEQEKECFSMPLDRSKLKGKSLTLSFQPLNMNDLPILNLQKEKPELVTLQNVSVRRAGGDVLNLFVDDDERGRLLTIPRFRKQTPPTEVLVGVNGDLLRGKLVSLDDKNVTFVSRLDEITVPRDRLAGVIWPQTEEAMEETARADVALTRVVFNDGSIMRMTVEQIIDDALVGQHPALGPIAIPVALTRELTMGGLVDTSSTNAFAAWKLQPAVEPKFAPANGAEGGADNASGLGSPLVGRPVPGFTAEMLDGSQFRISQQKGKVIVLDFWATWCGPCVKSMPHTSDTVAEFPGNKVMLLAVNQLETAETIHKFLDTRGLQINVALDHDGQIGRLFQVDAIPQLVVIDAEGNVQRVFVGDRGDLSEQLKETLLQLTSDQVEGETLSQ